MKYEQSLIDEIQGANDIVEVISQYVSLKRAGRNFKGLCPFHGEKTPSFMVQPEKQIFHCFGCSAGGDVFSFLMRHENMNFVEAVRELAERAQIRLPEREFRKEEGPTESERLYEVYRLAQEFYKNQFLHPEGGRTARAYMLKRHFKKEMWEELGIGWAPLQWQGLFDYLSQKKFSEDILIRSGLIKKSAKGRCFDVFRGRVIFPIQNLRAKIIGFGGRVIAEEGEGPKYLNSPENAIFKKRKELFGLVLAKKHIDPDRPRIIVVEGYLDFFRLYQEGFKASVATLGTSLTSDHVKLMKRFAQEAVVIYDGDKAGEAASLRGLEIFLEEGMNVKLIRMPPGFDPDDFLQKKGPEVFQNLLDNAKDFFDYKIEILLQKHNVEDPVGIVKITNDFLETLSKIKNPVLLSHYLKRLAAAVRLDENSLRAELARRSSQTQKRATPVEAGEATPAAKRFAPEEVLILGLILEDASLFDFASEALGDSDFQSPELRDLFRKMLVLEEGVAGNEVQSSRLLSSIRDESLKGELVGAISKDWNKEIREKTLQDCIRKIKRRNINLKLRELRYAIATAEKEGNPDQVGQFVQQYQSLLKTLPAI